MYSRASPGVSYCTTQSTRGKSSPRATWRKPNPEARNSES
jgi:hypothetical protein